MAIDLTPQAAKGGKSLAFYLSLALGIALHLGTVLYFAPPSVLFGDKPLGDNYYELRAGEMRVTTGALRHIGAPWHYQVRLNAGVPSGTAVDTNSRAWQLGTHLLTLTGMKRHHAHNLFVLVACLLAPFAVFGAARLFGLARLASLVAAGLAHLLWFYDGTLHFSWWAGNPDFAFAAYLALLAAALAYRALEGPRWWLVAVAAVVGALAVFTQGFAGLTLVVLVGALWVARFRKLATGGHLALGAILVAAFAANAYWIGLGLGFWIPGAGANQVGLGTLSHLLTDFLGLTADSKVSGGIGLKSGFRFLTFGAAAITLAVWRGDGDGRFRPILVGLATLLGVTYLGGYLPGLRETQPYRYVLPAMLLATIPAAQLVEEVRARKALANLPRLAVVVGLIILVAALPRLIRDVVYFVPALVITPQDLPEETPHISDIIGYGNIGYPRHRDYRLGRRPEYFDKAVKGLNQWKPEQGRVLVEYEPLAEHLAWRTRAEIIGGSRLRNPAHTAASYFTRYPLVNPSPEEIGRYLTTYAVGWVVAMNNPDLGEDDYIERLAGLDHLLEPKGNVWPFRVWRSKLPVSYFIEGSGQLKVGASWIKVTGSPANEDVVLKYHFLPGLVCKPGCALEEHPVEGDPLGFIRVPAPHPADFTIKYAH